MCASALSARTRTEADRCITVPFRIEPFDDLPRLRPKTRKEYSQDRLYKPWTGRFYIRAAPGREDQLFISTEERNQVKIVAAAILA
jgi:hypothetical protein